MGYIRHRLLVSQLPALEPHRSEKLAELTAWRDSLPEDWRRLIVGPVKGIVNGDEWVVFLPDGSKEGWADSKQGWDYAQQFAALVGPDQFDLVELTWGDEDPAARHGLSWGDDE